MELGGQVSLFDGARAFRVGRPIRLIEMFAGYGSQHFALRYLGAEVESWKVCEWAVKSIQAYRDAHFGDDDTDYSEGLTREQVFDYLAKKGISANYSEAMTREQIKRLGEEKARKIYNNIRATHNLVNIQQVRGRDLEIVDADKYCYVMTYSFPCQDLSLAGLGAGMAKGTGTRSGMLWEVERILDEIAGEGGQLPQVLLMENVPEVKGAKNIKDFAAWVAKLESLGYYCKWAVLNAKDYGVPQNRERCFMVSILGNDYYYDFPAKVALEKRLKDLLEVQVDERYYLSDKMLLHFTDMKDRNGLVRGERFKPIDADRKDYGYAIKTTEGSRVTDNFIICKESGNREPKIMDDNFISEPCLEQVGQIQGQYESTGRVYSPNGLAPTINTCGGGNREPKIIDDTYGYGGVRVYDDCPTIRAERQGLKVLEQNLKTQLCNKLIQDKLVKEGDVIRHSYSSNRLTNGAKNMGRIESKEHLSPTLDTRCDCLGVVVNDVPKDIGIVPYGTYYTWKDNQGNINTQCNRACDPNGCSLTIPTIAGMTKVIEPKPMKYVEKKLLETIEKNGGKVPEAADLYNSRPINNGIAGTLSTSCGNDCGCGSFAVINNYRIRKLTPKECFRLMGVKDQDFERIAQNQSNASLYHLAGDSIVTSVLMAIFGEMLGIDWRSKLWDIENKRGDI